MKLFIIVLLFVSAITFFSLRNEVRFVVDELQTLDISVIKMNTNENLEMKLSTIGFCYRTKHVSSQCYMVGHGQDIN